MADSYIDYDAKVQEALRQVVRSVLIDTEKDGLKGEHHFYIAFKTQADGVDIPAHLVSRFPDEMTIVIQHKLGDINNRHVRSYALYVGRHVISNRAADFAVITSV